MGRTLQAELKQATPFASLEEETLLSVQRTDDCLRRYLQQALKPFNITATQYNALRILRGAMPKGLACSELGERLVSSEPDITRLLGRLARQGLVDRQRDHGDRRVVMTVITPTGLTLLAELVPLLDARVRDALVHMPVEKLRILITLMEELRAPYQPRGPLSEQQDGAAAKDTAKGAGARKRAF